MAGSARRTRSKSARARGNWPEPPDTCSLARNKRRERWGLAEGKPNSRRGLSGNPSHENEISLSEPTRGVGGLRSKDAIDIGKGLGKLLEPEVRLRPAGVGEEVIGVPLDGGGFVRHGLVMLFQRGMASRPVVVRPGVIGAELNADGVSDDGLGEVAREEPGTSLPISRYPQSFSGRAWRNLAYSILAFLYASNALGVSLLLLKASPRQEISIAMPEMVHGRVGNDGLSLDPRRRPPLP